jgi:hypothetical protein
MRVNASAHSLTAQTDLELIFTLASSDRADLFASREVVLDALCKYLPEVSQGRRWAAASGRLQRPVTEPLLPSRTSLAKIAT